MHSDTCQHPKGDTLGLGDVLLGSGENNNKDNNTIKQQGAEGKELQQGEPPAGV